MDYEAIINNLQSNSNRVDTVKITFPEGMNTLEIANLFEKTEFVLQKRFSLLQIQINLTRVLR